MSISTLPLILTLYVQRGCTDLNGVGNLTYNLTYSNKINVKKEKLKYE